MIKQDSNITYQNKDIVSKVLAEKLSGKSLKVYGLDLPEIKELLPTNLPTIEANEMRIDNLFRLADDSLAILDYESVYKEESKYKYMEYGIRIAKKYQKELKNGTKIRMVVIYTADIEPGDTRDCLDLGFLTMTMNEAFLSQIDSEEVKRDLQLRVNSGMQLTEDELMKFIVLPLTYKGEEAKNTAIRESFELAKQINDEEIVTFVLSGMLVFTDKIINESLAKEIKEWMRMTKVGRLFEEEKIEAVKEGRKRGIEEGREEGREEGLLLSIRKLMEKGLSEHEIINLLDCTVEEIKQAKDLIIL